MVEYEPLVKLEQILRAKGQLEADLDQATLARYQQAIGTAEAACRTFADRRFGQKLETKTRVYEYEPEGMLDIDDAQKVLKVTFLFGELRTELNPFYWRAEPQEGPPYTYLKIPHWTGVYDPAMGFTRNLDVLARDRGWPWMIPQVEVEAEWGWPEVPLDVQQAVIYTAIDFADIPDPYVSESIQGYSYQTAIRTTAGPGQSDLLPTAIPGKAQDLLLPFVRFQF